MKPFARIGIALALLIGVSASTAALQRPSFGGPRSYQAGRGPVSVAAADLNAGGANDLAEGNFKDATVSVRLGGRNGTGAYRHPLAVDTEPATVGIAVLGGDATLGLAVTTSDPCTVS